MNEPDNSPQRMADTLGMPIAEMRRLGHQVVDLVIDHLANRNDQPAIVSGEYDRLAELLGGPPPRSPGSADEAIRSLCEVALRSQQHGDHPRYFARVPGPSSFGAILGDWLATGFNGMAASWGGGAGPTTVELVALDWLRELLGLPAGAEGIFTSGGSMANFTACGAAVAALGPGRVYLSDQSHSSLARGLALLGAGGRDLCVLESDDCLRLPVSRLVARVEDDLRRGIRPIMVAASAGTTNTGAVDPLDELADVCGRFRMWLHVDGAYGAPAAMTPEGRTVLGSLARADSVVVDPHKWLFQPYDMGCVFVMRPGALESAYSTNPEYLRDVASPAGEHDLRNRSLELTRRARAMKLWLTLKIYGADRLRSAIERGMELARHAERHLRCRPDVWRVVTPASLGIVTFALRGADQATHERMASRLAETGFAVVTSTLLKRSSVLRLCTINPLTSESDIERTIDRLAALGARPEA